MAYFDYTFLQHGDIIEIDLKPILPYIVIGKIIDYSYVLQPTKKEYFIHIYNLETDKTPKNTSDIKFQPDNLLTYPINIRPNEKLYKKSSHVKILDSTIVHESEFFENLIMLAIDNEKSTNIEGKLYSLNTNFDIPLKHKNNTYSIYFSLGYLNLEEVRMVVICEMLKLLNTTPDKLTLNDNEFKNRISFFWKLLQINPVPYSKSNYYSDYKNIYSELFTPRVANKEKIITYKEVTNNEGEIYVNISLWSSFSNIKLFVGLNLNPLPNIWNYIIWYYLIIYTNTIKSLKIGNDIYVLGKYIVVQYRTKIEKNKLNSSLEKVIADPKLLSTVLHQFHNKFKNTLLIYPKEEVRKIIGSTRIYYTNVFKQYVTTYMCFNKKNLYYSVVLDIEAICAMEPTIIEIPQNSLFYASNSSDFINQLFPDNKSKKKIHFWGRSIVISHIDENQCNSIFNFFRSVVQKPKTVVDLINLFNSQDYSSKGDSYIKQILQKRDLKINKENEPLEEELYWHLIEASLQGNPSLEQQYKNLVEILTEQKPNTILQFGIRTKVLCNKAQKADLWRAAYIMNSGCSDDGFDYFKLWLISRGKTVFESALENPDSLSLFDFEKDTEYEIEMFGEAYVEAFEGTYLRDIQKYVSFSKVSQHSKAKELYLEEKDFEDKILIKKLPNLFKKHEQMEV